MSFVKKMRRYNDKNRYRKTHEACENMLMVSANINFKICSRDSRSWLHTRDRTIRQSRDGVTWYDSRCLL